MKVLGISELDNDAGACAWAEGRVVAAANEERFSRVKQHAGFPFRVVEWITQESRFRPNDFDLIAIAKPAAADEIRLVRQSLRNQPGHASSQSTRWERLLTRLAFQCYRLPKHGRSVGRMNSELAAWLKESGLSESRLVRIDHHRAHALSAWICSGFDPCLVFTCDGQGGGVTGTVWRGEGNRLDPLQTIHLPHSMGNLYAAATKALGFTPNRHEGKVTGLAAYVPPEEEELAEVRRLAWVEDDRYFAPHVYGAYPRIRRLLDRVGPQRFAAAFQKVLEEVVAGWAATHIHKHGIHRVALSGGVFANVKLNQRVAEIEGVDEVFVFPGMADGGLGHGAAMGALIDAGIEPPRGLDHVFWGPDIIEAEAVTALDQARLSCSRPAHLEPTVARLLAKGKVVAVCRGRLEFGPRSLGNRSILYQPTDTSVNDWLNKRLSRTEFMPFAPITRLEKARECYPQLSSLSTARFMTITTNCSPGLRASSPAVVHVDGTARPQIVSSESQPFLHEVLENYERLTGIPCLINTSFNMHEEPIVCTAQDAVRAAIQARIDYLVLGPFLAEITPTVG